MLLLPATVMRFFGTSEYCWCCCGKAHRSEIQLLAYQRPAGTFLLSWAALCTSHWACRRTITPPHIFLASFWRQPGALGTPRKRITLLSSDSVQLTSLAAILEWLGNNVRMCRPSIHFLLFKRVFVTALQKLKLDHMMAHVATTSKRLQPMSQEVVNGSQAT